jgi:hypothetical protein
LKPIFKILISTILALFAGIIIMIMVMQLMFVFEAELLPRLLLPAIIIAIPAYMFIYWALFKKKRG